VTPLAPARLTDAYSAGISVVLFTTDDPLGADARAVAQRISEVLGDHVRFWDCRIRSAADTAEVECCRVPQYRFIVGGSEQSAHVGVLEDEQLLAMIRELS